MQTIGSSLRCHSDCFQVLRFQSHRDSICFTCAPIKMNVILQRMSAKIICLSFCSSCYHFIHFINNNVEERKLSGIKMIKWKNFFFKQENRTEVERKKTENFHDFVQICVIVLFALRIQFSCSSAVQLMTFSFFSVFTFFVDEAYRIFQNMSRPMGGNFVYFIHRRQETSVYQWMD